MTSARRAQIARSFQDKEYRDTFVEEHINSGLAFQIRATREDRGWSQSELGDAAGMAQERISVLENPDYGRFTLSTLRRLASAFDVALIVRFAPFSDLANHAAELSAADLAVPGFDCDVALRADSGEIATTAPDNVLFLSDYLPRSFEFGESVTGSPYGESSTTALNNDLLVEAISHG